MQEQTVDKSGERYMTYKEVAQRFRVNIRTVRRMVARNEMPQPIPLGRSRRFDAGEIDAVVEKLKGQRASFAMG